MEQDQRRLDRPASEPRRQADAARHDAVPEHARIAKARAYLGALTHIRLVPIFAKNHAGDNSGMGHLSASRQSVDNLLLLGFKGTIEVIYSNNGHSEDAFRDLFPAFPDGGDLTGPAGEKVRIDYIPQDPRPGSGKTGLRQLTEDLDVHRRNEKARGTYPRRHVQLINNWDAIMGSLDDDLDVAGVFSAVTQAMNSNPQMKLDLDPGDARYIVGLLAFGWTQSGRQFVYDSKNRKGYDLALPNKHLVSYLRPPYPDPIAAASAQGREGVPGAIREFMARHPILKDNSPLQVLVSGFQGGTLTINCLRGTTVAQLKQWVWGRTAIPAQLQSLQLNGRVLVDGKMLDEYGALNGIVIRGNVRGGHVPGDPGHADAAAVTAAPPGKLVDLNTTGTIAAILEGTALGTWDLLPGYGFHNAGNQSLDRVARSARQAQVALGRRRPIVFISMRHPRVPSEALLQHPGIRYFKAEDPDATAQLATLQPGQVAIVVAGGGTASFAIQQGIPYIALADNGSIVTTPPGTEGDKRLRAIGGWLSSSGPKTETDEMAMVDTLAQTMVEAVQPDTAMARYFRTLKEEVRKPEQQQMAAAFERLYGLTKPKITVCRASGQPAQARPGDEISFTVVFSKAPAAFAAPQVTLSGTGTVNPAAARIRVTPLPSPPQGKYGKVAVAYGLSVQGVDGAGLLTASVADRAVQEVGGASFPASISDNRENTVTLVG